MYEWKKLSTEAKAELLTYRKHMKLPWHSPPHFENDHNTFIISAANYEHHLIIGDTLERMAEFSNTLLDVLSKHSKKIYAWCILPNHYHVVVETNDLKYTIYGLGQMHGRLSRFWNVEDNSPHRKCWHHCMDRAIRNDRHLYAAVNYVHYNPIKHRYVEKMNDWALSSFEGYIEVLGRNRAVEIWKEHPILGMGQGWDD